MIVGSDASLGAWNPDGAARLTWSEGDVWVGAAIVGSAEGAAAVVEFKLVVAAPHGGGYDWEECENRVLPASGVPLMVTGALGGDVRVAAEDGSAPKTSSTRRRRRAHPLLHRRPARREHGPAPRAHAGDELRGRLAWPADAVDAAPRREHGGVPDGHREESRPGGLRGFETASRPGDQSGDRRLARSAFVLDQAGAHPVHRGPRPRAVRGEARCHLNVPALDRRGAHRVRGGWPPPPPGSPGGCVPRRLHQPRDGGGAEPQYGKHGAPVSSVERQLMHAPPAPVAAQLSERVRARCR